MPDNNKKTQILFVIKNQYLIGLASWLNELQLVGKESRVRTRFVNLLKMAIQEYQKFSNSLIEEYCPKDEKGKPKLKNVNGKTFYDIPEEKAKKFADQIREYSENDFNLEITSDYKGDFGTLKRIVLNTDYKFGPVDGKEREAKIRQSEDYDEWCKSFENLVIKNYPESVDTKKNDLMRKLENPE